MGTTIYIGFLADRDGEEQPNPGRLETVNKINTLLKKHGVPEHQEPQAWPDVPEHQGYWNAMLGSDAEGELKDLLERTLEEDALDISRACANHLLKVNFNKGFWLPIDFRDVIADKKVHVGSAYRLLEICEALAQRFKLPVPLDAIPLDESGDASELNEFFEEQTGEPLWDQEDGVAKELCITLYQAARLSILNKMMLCCG